MITRRASSLALSVSLSLSFVAVALSARSAGAQALEPPHLTWAVLLVENTLPEHNVYGTSPNYVFWEGVNGATRYESRTQCNSLLTHLLRQGYGLTSSDIREWTGSTSPSAALWHDTIVSENRWSLVGSIDEVLPGDVLAIRYPSGSAVSGHVATVVDVPALRASTSPVIAETFQYEVSVVDSTAAGHGPSDTRWQADGTWDAGAGIGTMRLYTFADGTLAGHTWSLNSGSLFYDQSTRPLALGRPPARPPARPAR